jgi:DNA-directed RNA polymerase specialized sigma24 family protein
MAELPGQQAEAVRLRYLLGTSYIEMTALLGAPESTLRSRVKAGLGRLRELLADYFAEDGR